MSTKITCRTGPKPLIKASAAAGKPSISASVGAGRLLIKALVGQLHLNPIVLLSISAQDAGLSADQLAAHLSKTLSLASVGASSDQANIGLVAGSYRSISFNDIGASSDDAQTNKYSSISVDSAGSSLDSVAARLEALIALTDSGSSVDICGVGSSQKTSSIDSGSGSDSVNSSVRIIISASDTGAATEIVNVNRLASGSIRVSDSGSSADSCDFKLSTSVSADDSGSSTDLINLGRAASGSISVNDAGNSSDAATFSASASISLSDSGSSTDAAAIAKAQSLSVTDYGDSIDTVSVLKQSSISADSSGSSSDSALLNSQQSASVVDSGAGSDSVAIGSSTSISAADTGSSTDSLLIGQAAAISAADSGSSTDLSTINKSQNAVAADSGSSSDTLLISESKAINVSDAGTSSDTASATSSGGTTDPFAGRLANVNSTNRTRVTDAITTAQSGKSYTLDDLITLLESADLAIGTSQYSISNAYSDDAGTTPAAVGDSIALVKSWSNSTNTATQTNSSNRPTLTNDGYHNVHYDIVKYLKLDSSLIVGTDYTLIGYTARAGGAEQSNYIFASDAVSSNQTLLFGYQNLSGTILFSQFADDLTANWISDETHELEYDLLCAVATPTSRQIYYNGSQVASSTPSGSHLTSLTNFAATQSNFTDVFSGYIKQLFIYKQALTATQIGMIKDFIDAYHGSDPSPTAPTVPAAPTGLTVSTATAGTLAVSWTASTAGTGDTAVSQYRVMISPSYDSGNWQNRQDTGSTSYTYTGLTAGDQWHVRVAAKGNLGHSAWLTSTGTYTVS
jgi:hypothetical protein